MRRAISVATKISYSRYKGESPLYKELGKVEEIYRMRVKEVKRERKRKKEEAIFKEWLFSFRNIT